MPIKNAVSHLFRPAAAIHLQSHLVPCSMYKLRIQADPSDASSPKLLTSIPARCLASAGFKDNLQASTMKHLPLLRYAAHGRLLATTEKVKW